MDRKPTIDTNNGIVRLVREEPPAHCIFRVESLSKLYVDHVVSSEFKAGGYTWVLCVYPKGHKQKGGDNHLSVFVSMVDKLSSDSFVYVMPRFFIYDHHKENFLTVLDARDKLIHTDMESVTGIPKFIPLSTFTHASNGFLVNDCCVFGAEVFVKDAPNIRACEVASGFIDRAGFNKNNCAAPSPWSYTWKIEKFSQLTTLESPVFQIGDWSWKLYINKNKTGLENRKYLVVGLELQNPNDIPVGSSLDTQFQLRLKNQVGREDHKKTTSRDFPRASTEEAWGLSSFIQIIDLHSKGFLVNDTLILEVRIEEMFIP